MFSIVFGLFAVAFALLCYYLTSSLSYWRKKGVPCLEAYPLVGSMAHVLTLQQHMSEFFHDAYYRFYDAPYVGFIQGRSPAIMVKDPDLIKDILVKDFQHFVNHGFIVDEKINPLQAKNLFNMMGPKWKEMRSRLSPTFTSGRMKSMYPLVLECAEAFEKHLNELAKERAEVNIKDVLARYTTDVISSCAFGVQTDSMNNPNNEFRTMGRRIFQPNFIMGIKRAFVVFAPEVAKFFRIKFSDDEVSQFFRDMVRNVIEMRSRTGTIRKDFMQLLIELKEKGKLADEDAGDEKQEQQDEAEHLKHNHTTYKWTNDDITAQALVFFIAGFETSSSAMTFALFELSRRPDLQRTARRHIEEVLQRHDGQVTYQALQEMTYLDWILQESLRKYPPVGALNRRCTKNYIIPGSNVSIEEGTPLFIPISALQNDLRYFPEPERFDPERFADADFLHKNQFIHMPFGEGPRQCIGMRFSKIQAKLGLMSVLRKFDVSISPKTKFPLVIDRRQFLLCSKEDIIIKIAPRNDLDTTN